MQLQAPTLRQWTVLLVVLLVGVVAAVLYWNPHRMTVSGLPGKKLSVSARIPTKLQPRQSSQQLQINLEKIQAEMKMKLDQQLKGQEKVIKDQGQRLAAQDSLMKKLQEEIKNFKLQRQQQDGGQGVQTTKSTNPKNISPRINVYAPTDLPSVGMQKATLRVASSTTPIYVYNSADLISRSIIQSQRWETGQMLHTEKLLTADKDLQFMDFGCNLGVYTILAAKMGRKVVAVDANIENLKRLRRSLMDAKLESQATLLLNAIHQVHKSYMLRHYPSNIGGDHIYEVADGTAGAVKSVTMDEIYEVMTFKKALMKLDIEGSEFDALHKADKLFTQIEIPVVFMEWGVINRDHKDGKVQEWILAFFDRHGYAPCQHAFSSKALNKNHFTWPWDIVWKKKKDLSL